MRNRVIGVCGFGYTGSGAVIDYLMETGKLCRVPQAEVMPPLELNIAFMPDGLLDLEHHLCHRHSRFMNSDMAIFRFKDRMAGLAAKKLPDPQLRKDFLKRVDQYLNSLIQIRWFGYSVMWKYCAPKAKDPRSNQFFFRVRRKLAKLLYQPIPERLDREMYLSINPEDFLGKTRSFVSDILELLTKQTGGAGMHSCWTSPFRQMIRCPYFNILRIPKPLWFNAIREICMYC